MDLHDFILLLHIIGAGILIGVAVFSLVLSVSKSLTKERLQTIALIRQFGTYSVVLLFLSGVYLAWRHFGGWPTTLRFWTKMALIVVDGILAQVVIKQKINRAINEDEETFRNNLPIWTAISALIIFMIVTLGFLTTSGD